MTKKSLYKPRALTYEEHERMDKFFRYFTKEGMVIFDLLRQAFGDYEEPIRRMALAINLMSPIHQYCEDKAFKDRIVNYEEFEKWNKLYREIGLWSTSGWDKQKRK